MNMEYQPLLSRIGLIKNIKKEETKKAKECTEEIKKRKTPYIKNFFETAKANRKYAKDILKFENDWIDLMANAGLYNKAKETYSLNNLKKTNFGYEADIYLVATCIYSELESPKTREYIENKFGCMLILNKDSKRSSWAHAEFIFHAPEDLKFSPPEGLKPWELYIGNKFNGEPIILDLIKYPHMLLSGGTRAGKSCLYDCVLTTLIHDCSPDELNLYLLQVAKSDLILYSQVKHCKAFANNLDKAIVMLEYLLKEMDRRTALIEPYRLKAKAKNYHEYNKLKYVEYLPTIIVASDEASELFNTQGDSKEVKAKKQSVDAMLQDISRYGAALGVFSIVALQRPTVQNLNPLIKSQATIAVSLRQNNSKSSEVAIDDPVLAVGLEQREFVYTLTGSACYGIVPWINDDLVYACLEPHIGHSYSDVFRQMEKDKEHADKNYDEKEKLEDKEKINDSTVYEADCKEKINNDKVKIESKATPKTREQILAENIAQITGFVPYEPPNSNKKDTIIKDREEVNKKQDGWYMLENKEKID